jgi:hypothetical protein
MRDIRKAVHNIFVWSYARGTLQYDIICALILAFIFLVPRSCFVSRITITSHAASPKSTLAAQQIIKAEAHR